MAGKFSTASKAYFGPSRDATIDASDILDYVNGRNCEPKHVKQAAKHDNDDKKAKGIL